MKNYKKIRQKPYIYGLTLLGLIVFIAIIAVCAITLIFRFSVLNGIVILIVIGISFLFCKHILSDKKFESMIFDNKLPKKYSKYE